jgi:hypothetical protein
LRRQGVLLKKAWQAEVLTRDWHVQAPCNSAPKMSVLHSNRTQYPPFWGYLFFKKTHTITFLFGGKTIKAGFYRQKLPIGMGGKNGDGQKLTCRVT